MIDRNILLEKMHQFGIDWIGSQGFLDDGQVNHVLDIVEKESGLTQRAADGARFCPACHALLEEHSVYCDTCGTDTPRR